MLIPLVVLNLAYIQCEGSTTHFLLSEYGLPKSAFKFRFVMQWYLKLDFYKWRHR